MSKSLLLIILLLLGSYNLFSQRLCEESFPNISIHKTENPGIILVIGESNLRWYDAENCEFVNEMLIQKQNPKRAVLSDDKKGCLIYFSNGVDEFDLCRYDLINNTIVKEYDFEKFSTTIFPSAFTSNNSFTSIIGADSEDGKLKEFSIDNLELLNVKDLPGIGYDQMVKSVDGSMIAVYPSYKDFGGEIVVFNTEPLEQITSVNFNDYFSFTDIDDAKQAIFNPINNELLLISETQIKSVDLITRESKQLLKDQIIYNVSIDKTDDNKLIISGLDQGLSNIGVINPYDPNDFYKIDERSWGLIVYEDDIISRTPGSNVSLYKTPIIPVSVDDPFESVNVFPNPTTGLVNYSISSINFVFSDLEVLDSNGGLISHQELNANSENLYEGNIDLAHLTNGVYIIRFIGEDTYSKKIVLEK